MTAIELYSAVSAIYVVPLFLEMVCIQLSGIVGADEPPPLGCYMFQAYVPIAVA